MIRNTLLCSVLAASLTACGLSTAKHERDQKELVSQRAQGLEIILAAGKPSYTVGEHPDISVYIRNNRNMPVWLVGSLDGSAAKTRYPYCWFEVYDQDGKDMIAKGSVCGTTAELEKEDIVRVQPLGGFNPYSSGFFPEYIIKNWKPQKPGTYRVVFNYSTNSSDPAEWNGTQDLINEVVKVELKKGNNDTCRIDLLIISSPCL